VIVDPDWLARRMLAVTMLVALALAAIVMLVIRGGGWR